MKPAFKKTRKPWRGAAGGLLIRIAAAAAVAALSLPAWADSWLDSFNPFKLFAGEKYETKIVPDIPADDLYNQALARLQSKDYDGAAKKFAELEKQYPYSQWQRKAILMTTFSQYQNASYDDAIASAKRYIGLFPSSPDVPYAYYLAGTQKRDGQMLDRWKCVPEALANLSRAGIRTSENAFAGWLANAKAYPKRRCSVGLDFFFTAT